MKDNLEIRVFISYSSKDKPIVKLLAQVLKDNGLQPMWARDFLPGSGFHEQIKDYIAYAHIFMPLVTKSSAKRGWVHQEIGYAMALNIPVFPITTEDVKPGEMIQNLQAVKIPGDSSKLRKNLTRDVFINLLNRSQKPGNALYELAELGEDRAKMMKAYSDNVLNLGHHCLVRQKGGISSFHIPKKSLQDVAWRDRYLPDKQTEDHNRCQRNERLSLEKHAGIQGCKLIINPEYVLEKSDPRSKISRLQTLIEFLEYMPDEKVTIAINAKMATSESVTMVGNWFMAESVTKQVRGSFRNTIFTKHAPTINGRIEEFDLELSELLDQAGWKSSESRLKVMSILKKHVENLEKMVKDKDKDRNQ